MNSEVRNLIDNLCAKMSKEEYVDFLRGIIDELEERLDVTEQEIEDDGLHE